MHCSPQCPPSSHDVLSLLLSHFPDIVAQAIYIGMGYLVFAWGGELFGEERRLHGFLAGSGRALQATSPMEAAEIAEGALLLWYWAVVAGAFTGALLVIKSACAVAGELFEYLSRLDKVVGKAVDRLKAELPNDLSEMLEDALSTQTGKPSNIEDGKALAEGAKAEVAKVAAPISRAIDEARKELEPSVLLPSVLRSHLLFGLLLAAPPLAVVALKTTVDWAVGPPTGEPGRLLSPALGWSDFTASAGQLWPNALLNVVWSLLSSWPAQRFVSNNAIKVVERRANVQMLRAVQANLPGGIQTLQATLDEAHRSVTSKSSGRNGGKGNCVVQ